MSEAVPPSLQGPSAKEKKYDRQLRLWGANGQIALENSHILLLNSGPGVVGLETLKNLVLPGIGKFTIHDTAKVTEKDLGVNFFLEEADIGRPRAEVTCAHLKELNPDVEGSWVDDGLEAFLRNPDTSLSYYTLILVVAPILPVILKQLVGYAWRANIPLFYIHSVGFYSQFSVQLPAVFPVVDTHPSPESTTELRLLSPWPELIQYTKEKTSGLEQMSDEDHGHVPYISLLLYYLEKWKNEHDGQPPLNYKEKTAFRTIVANGARTDTPEGGEENYDEAVAAVLKSLNPSEPSSALKELFMAEECRNITPQSTPFWIIARAISMFYQKYKVLPLPGSVPDMKARSADYIQLQNVYKSKARADLAEVLENVRALEQEFERPKVEEKEVEAFCKNATHVKLVRGQPIQVLSGDEMLDSEHRMKNLGKLLQFSDPLFSLYLAFVAFDRFISVTHKYDADGNLVAPGETNVKEDTDTVTSLAVNVIQDLTKEAKITLEADRLSELRSTTEKFVKELVRAGGAELHNIAALTGGLVSQEVIKAITEQYIPVDNTCVFDGVNSKTAVFRI